MADDLDQLISDLLYSSNQYGAGPGQVQSNKDQYKGIGYMEDAISDYMKVMGVYPEDLLGLAPEPEAPGDRPVMPNLYQSDLAAAYGGNRLAQVIMQEIAQGTDPVLAANTAIEKYNASPDDYVGMVPQSSSNDAFNNYDPVVSWANQFATDYAEDYSKGNRQNTEALSEYQRALDDYAKKDEAYFRYNNPVSGLYEYRDPVTGAEASLDDFESQLGLDRGRFGGVQDVVTKVNYEPRRDLSRDPGISGISGVSGSGVTRFDNKAFTRDTLARQGAPMSKEYGKATGATADVQRERERRAKQSYSELKNQRVASGREIDNQKRAALAQVLFGMR